MWKKVLGVTASAGALALALAVPAHASTGTSTDPAGTAASAATTAVVWYPKHVKSTVSSVRVFTSPTGQNIYGHFGPCHNFWTDRNDGGRYHIVLTGGVDAWVTADSQWVAQGHC